MNNPFEEIIERFDKLEERFLALNTSTNPPTIEIIDRDELCRRLSITEPTVIRYEKKKIIPAIRIGSSVRYNWPSVVNALEKKN
jgi:hypothetical protein